MGFEGPLIPNRVAVLPLLLGVLVGVPSGACRHVAATGTDLNRPNDLAGTVEPAEPPPAPPTDNSGFAADFEAAISALAANERASARNRLNSLLQSLVGAELRPTAAALLAKLWLAEGQVEAAKQLLEKEKPPGVHRGFALVQALVTARGPNAASVRAELKAAASDLPSLPGIDTDELRLSALAGWAQAASTSGAPLEAIEAWQQYFYLGSESERHYAVIRADAEAAKLTPVQALAQLESNSHPLPIMVLGGRAQLALLAAGKIAEAESLRTRVTNLRAEQMPVAAAATSGTGDPSRIGLAVPLSGKGLPLGLAVARGAMVAIGKPSTAVSGFQIVLRNSSAEGGGPRSAADGLAVQEAALGIIGLPDPGAIEVAGQHGVPYLLLGDASPGAGSSSFQLIHGAEARTRTLVEIAIKRGAKRFALLFSDDEDGQKNRDRFGEAVAKLGGRVAIAVAYPPQTTTFSKEIKTLSGTPFDALFVPATANRLELIAPALAVADLWSTPSDRMTVKTGTERPRNNKEPVRREILLLSTATGLSHETIARAGRYLQGALLTPGFFPDEAHATEGSFTATFRGLYGRDPGASEAFGFDGVQLLRTCVERGARSRQQVMQMLTDQETIGVTGRMRFGADHTRVDPARLYEVSGNEINAAN